MLEQHGYHGSINHIRQHKVRLRKKPVLLLAVIFLSGLLISCGRLDMEGYVPSGTDEESQDMNQETPDVITSSPIEPGDALFPEPKQNTKPEPVDTPAPVITQEPAEEPAITSEPSVTPEPIPISTPEPSSTPTPTAAPAPSNTPVPTPSQETQLENTAKIVNPYVPYTYDQMIEDSKKLKDTYPDLLTLDVAGYSVEGRELMLIKLGNGEKKIILCGSHHAREYITSSYLMKMLEVYSKAYYSAANYGKYDVRDILNQITLYVVPMVNPDGVNLVINGLEAVDDQQAVSAMAMLRNTYKEWKANINGVDLNRQYPAEWDKKYDEVGKPASESFKGEAFATEPEIKAMMELSKNNEFILAASFHTKGNVIYWADRGTVDLIPGVKEMAKRLSSLTKYSRMPVSEDPSIYGAGYENWFRLEFLRPAFCIELTPYNNTDVPHNDKKFDSLVWTKAKYIGLFLAEEALKR